MRTPARMSGRLLPLIMLVFGIGETSRVIVVALAAFFPMLVSVMAGVRQISPVYFEVAQNYGAPRRKVFSHVVLPGSFDFGVGVDEARRLIDGCPARIARILEGRNAARKPSPDTWSPAGYVWHLADAIRAWGERLIGIGRDPAFRIVPFDQDELARVRGYDRLSPIVGLWALGRAVEDLDRALDEVDVRTPLEHPEFGAGTVADVVRWIAHEAHHHELDVRRGILPE